MEKQMHKSWNWKNSGNKPQISSSKDSYLSGQPSTLLGHALPREILKARLNCFLTVYIVSQLQDSFHQEILVNFCSLCNADD